MMPALPRKSAWRRRAEVCVRTARDVVLPDGAAITGPDDPAQHLSILSLPAAQRTFVPTNTFASSGNFNYTNPSTPGTPQKFYAPLVPGN